MNAKTKRIVGWILAGLLGAAFIFFSIGKLTGNEETVKEFARLGYTSATFMLIIGILEAAGALGLLIPKLRILAALGLFIIMGGAVYSHIAAGDPLTSSIPAAVLMLLLGLLVYVTTAKVKE